jgi:cell division topological specificity factor MinE
MSLFNRLLRRNTKSKDVAKNRLQQTLVHDRAHRSPGKREHHRGDLVQAMSRFAEIDQDVMNIVQVDANRQSCITAHIPVIGATSK